MKNKFLILEDSAERIMAFRKKYGADAELFITDQAKTAINLLEKHKFDIIFLDHDLGGKQMEFEEENCGMVVADYIANNNIKTPTVVHSFNIERALLMKKVIGDTAVYLPGCWL